MLGGVVKLQLPGNGAGFFWRKRFVEGGCFVGVQVVQNNPNHFGVRVAFNDVPHGVSKIDFGAALHDQHIPPAPLRFADHHQIAHAVTLVLGVLTRRLARLGRGPRLGGLGIAAAFYVVVGILWLLGSTVARATLHPATPVGWILLGGVPILVLGEIVEQYKLGGVETLALGPLIHEAVEPLALDYRVPVPSAQVKSACLLAGLCARGVTRVVEPEATRDHTENMLRHFGAVVDVAEEGEGRVIELLGQRVPVSRRIEPALDGP